MTIFAATIALIWPAPPMEVRNTNRDFHRIPENMRYVNFAPYKPVHRRIIVHPQPPMQTAVASYYDLGGDGACGIPAQSGYQFANLSMACGTRVEFCYQTCVVGIMDDRGPYVAGRLFDLNVNLQEALGCGGLCSVRWRIE